MLEDVVDVGGGGHGLGDVQVPGGVGGADDPVLGPGDDEQDRLLGAQEDPGLGVDGLLGDHDVDALGGQDLQASRVGGQVLDVLGPHSGGVNGALGPDLVVGAGGQVGDAGAVDMAALVGEEAGDLRAVGGQRPQADGGAHQVDDQAGVVDPGVEEADGAGQAAGVQGGGQGGGALAAQVALDRHGLAAAGAGQGQGVVHAHADRGVGALVVVLERPQEGLGLDQVRRGGAQQAAALGEGLVHEGEVELVEVAQAAVDELGGPRGGARGPVAHLHDAGAQAAGRGVQGDAGAGDAPADDQHVQALGGRHLLQGALALGGVERGVLDGCGVGGASRAGAAGGLLGRGLAGGGHGSWAPTCREIETDGSVWGRSALTGVPDGRQVGSRLPAPGPAAFPRARTALVWWRTPLSAERGRMRKGCARMCTRLSRYPQECPHNCVDGSPEQDIRCRRREDRSLPRRAAAVWSRPVVGGRSRMEQGGRRDWQNRC